MKKRIVMAFVLGAVALGAGTSFAEFKAGFGRVDATPPLGIPIVGYFHKRIADGVLDPLYVDCVAVSDGTNNALIYCVSSLGLGKAFMGKATSALTAATGVPRERIYVHATHTASWRAMWTRALPRCPKPDGSRSPTWPLRGSASPRPSAATSRSSAGTA